MVFNLPATLKPSPMLIVSGVLMKHNARGVNNKDDTQRPTGVAISSLPSPKTTTMNYLYIIFHLIS
jgi:hypothetical protein